MGIAIFLPLFSFFHRKFYHKSEKNSSLLNKKLE
ncbi:hypothetical protein SP_0059 [Streptococcus pneumoniae TIGR4]|uniref:Uncharacterized protein n=1 Tax=Streptococcus pneumoniae serotype 4 (strain ATCC BAA-334 / TIGR4) TaxID=170187 RepID=A0A0H2UMX8_STRPN|nr:hypothetical protein SP_0059 [Streptococcus pneumoniae TIGR4]